jgi:hypothetical protein
MYKVKKQQTICDQQLLLTKKVRTIDLKKIHIPINFA